MYLPYDTGFGFAHCICGGETASAAALTRKKKKYNR